jgi:hypothetical protein
MNLFNPVGTPGLPTQRRYFNYTPYQQALWVAFDDTYHAAAFGYSHTRYSDPTGGPIQQERYERWQERAIREWGVESQRDLRTRGPGTKDTLPEHLWKYLYSRMVAADPLKGQF